MRRVASSTQTLPYRAVYKTCILDFRGLFFMATKTKFGLLRPVLEKFFEVGCMGGMTTRTLSFDDRFMGHPGDPDLRDLIGIFLLIHVTTET